MTGRRGAVFSEEEKGDDAKINPGIFWLTYVQQRRSKAKPNLEGILGEREGGAEKDRFLAWLFSKKGSIEN